MEAAQDIHSIPTSPRQSMTELDEDHAVKVPAASTDDGAAVNEVEGEEKADETPVELLPDAHSSALELIAKGRAPVKREFLRAAGVRVIASASLPDQDLEGTKNDTQSEKNDGGASKISTVKKSKRQQKRERIEARKSAENICGAVAKANDVNACPYGQGCRFNHDLSAFLAQKPPDLSGQCPFMALNKPCPFGAACRLSGTHQEKNAMDVGSLEAEDGDELNALKKDFQKLLWKNSVSFPRADSQLQTMDLLGKAKKVAAKTSNSQLDGTVEIMSKDQSSIQQTENTQSSDVDKSAIMQDECMLTLSSCPAEVNGSVESTSKVKCTTNGHSLVSESADKQLGEGIILQASKKQKTDVSKESLKPESTNDESVLPLQDSAHLSCSNPENLRCGVDVECRLTKREKKLIDFKGKVYVAPLTTVGNLPFRRVCKQLGADITCGEMAMCINLLQGQASEWALLRRHHSEDVFGVQICGAYPDTVARTTELIDRECQVSFIDLNVGCPIDLVVNKGAGSCLLTKPMRLQQIVRAASASTDNPFTLKVRTGYFEGRNCVHSFITDVHNWGASALTIHGRTRQQRYSKLADWNYVYEIGSLASDQLQVIGNGDIFSYTDWNDHLSRSKLSTCMLARGVLIKPWLLTEIKEQRHWDISSNERFKILQDYVRFGLEHWGSDSKGVETTRHFLLEWLSYMHRYIPVGLLEVLPQRLNWRPPHYYGRNELETLMASDSAADWVRISEMLLGSAPRNFSFTPRHKSNAYDRPENG